MDDTLISEPGVSPERASLLPGEGFFLPDEIRERREREAAAAELAGVDTAVVADPDADGLACVALLRELVDPDAALVDAGPHEITTGLEYVTEHAPEGVDVFVCDLCPDSAEWLEEPLLELLDHAGSVRWFDHHQWDRAVAETVRESGVDLVVGDSDEECTADVTARSLAVEVPPRLLDLAAATRDHDLWIREDARSDDLADYSYWSNAEQYVSTVREHGADLPEDVLSYLEDQRETKDDRIDRAVRRAEYREVGAYTVGITYGRCSQNEVAEAMREAGADAGVVVKPSGSASIRGTESFERCHLVAGRVNGGGHPKAAGCKPEIYDDMLDYAAHWSSQGATAKRVILRAFDAVIDTTESESDHPAENGSDHPTENDPDHPAENESAHDEPTVGTTDEE
jgi:oligoribonuclease NrnB/cAMP/cGMP phosphodiesterase (DHH superfamily)